MGCTGKWTHGLKPAVPYNLILTHAQMGVSQNKGTPKTAAFLLVCLKNINQKGGLAFILLPLHALFMLGHSNCLTPRRVRDSRAGFSARRWLAQAPWPRRERLTESVCVSLWMVAKSISHRSFTQKEASIPQRKYQEMVSTMETPSAKSSSSSTEPRLTQA